MCWLSSQYDVDWLQGLNQFSLLEGDYSAHRPLLRSAVRLRLLLGLLVGLGLWVRLEAESDHGVDV